MPEFQITYRQVFEVVDLVEARNAHHAASRWLAGLHENLEQHPQKILDDQLRITGDGEDIDGRLILDKVTGQEWFEADPV